MTIDIVGGTYGEICIDPPWREIYGSGLRAAHALSGRGVKILLHSCISGSDFSEVENIAQSIGIDLHPVASEETYHFQYDYPLANPSFNSPDRKSFHDKIVSKNLLQFGMIEGNFEIHAENVVYDPQSPTAPKSFWLNNSSADQLIWISNFEEASKFTGSEVLSEISNYLFVTEKVSSAIIKMGSDGALLFESPGQEIIYIPAYITKTVWPIGTGDIFSAAFAYYYLIESLTIFEAAKKASLMTAYYSENVVLPLPLQTEGFGYPEFRKNTNLRKKVYLAGPFFNLAQRWLVEQARNQLIKFGFDVFSPFHDVGLGPAEYVAPLDIQAINDCDIMIALLDGFDPGTLFEVGYANSKDIPIIAFIESIECPNLTMIKGVNCMIETDFSTLIYKTVWEAYK